MYAIHTKYKIYSMIYGQMAQHTELTEGCQRMGEKIESEKRERD